MRGSLLFLFAIFISISGAHSMEIEEHIKMRMILIEQAPELHAFNTYGMHSQLGCYMSMNLINDQQGLAGDCIKKEAEDWPRPEFTREMLKPIDEDQRAYRMPQSSPRSVQPSLGW